MPMKGRSILYVLIVLFFIPLIAAQEEHHLTLLAVQEGNGGSVADLYLELRPGTGRVFLDTYPVTKMDTQISTRFAKEIACQQFSLNCNQYDFIYTIRANSNIIGGPSAGAAIAVLTALAVMDIPYDDSIAITATINSGGIIGPVGGVDEKLDAASRAGIQKVLVAQGNIPNGSITSLPVIEVTTLHQVISHFTGKNFVPDVPAELRNDEYQKIMEGLQEDLCTRKGKLWGEIIGKGMVINGTVEEELTRLEGSIINSSARHDFYSAASFCFNANILLKNFYYGQVSLKLKHQQEEKLRQNIARTEEAIALRKIQTISDLQAMMAVQERLKEVTYHLEQNGSIAYGEERYYSALSWMKFFDMPGRMFQMDDTVLRTSCLQKISEAEDRVQYASLYLLPEQVSYIQEKIKNSQTALSRNAPVLCLSLAAQAKGDANAIISSIGVPKESFPQFLAGKRDAVARVIAENTKEGIFPILGYSYYQYAGTLKDTEPYASLVYLEYALELSDLSIYFPEEKNVSFPLVYSSPETVLLVEGIVLGVFGTLLFLVVFRRLQVQNKR